MKILKYLTLFLLLQSCASAYKPIYPKYVKHNMHENVLDLSFSYKYDALTDNGNGKYARRAKMKGYQVVAYKITNNSNDTLVVGEDISFMAKNEKLVLSDDLYKTKAVKQYPIGFLPYISGSYFVLYTGVEKQQNGSVTFDGVVPIGLIISFPIMLGNMIQAGMSNTKFKDNLRLNDMYGKAIAPKASIYGMLVFMSQEQIPLSIAKNKQYLGF